MYGMAGGSNSTTRTLIIGVAFTVKGLVGIDRIIIGVAFTVNGLFVETIILGFGIILGLRQK